MGISWFSIKNHQKKQVFNRFFMEFHGVQRPSSLFSTRSSRRFRYVMSASVFLSGVCDLRPHGGLRWPLGRSIQLPQQAALALAPAARGRPGPSEVPRGEQRWETIGNSMEIASENRWKLMEMPRKSANFMRNRGVRSRNRRRIEAARPCQALFVTFVIATFNFWVVAWSTDGPTTWLDSRPVKRLLEVANRLVYSLYDAIIAYK